MKQPEHSKATLKATIETSQPRERGQKRKRLTSLRDKLMKVILVSVGVAFLITIYVLANKSSNRKGDDTPIIPPTMEKRIEVEVLDGAGRMKVARRVTYVLRARGYDVVEMKKNSDGIVERSFVIDRSGNLDAARKLAADLGIPENKVFQKIDRQLYLDLTVVIGKDYAQLKAFQSSTERNTH